MLALPFLLFAALQDPAEDLELALRKLRPAAGLRVGLYAAEPKVANPVGIAVDERGRVFVAETRRYNTSALYIVRHGEVYFEDLACRTTEDRLAVSRKLLGADAGRLEKDSEVVRLLEDTDGDGRADRAEVFAEDFRSMLDGVASGVLARGDTVWLANVPNLWALRGKERKILSSGYGVRFGNSGHDLHGLVFGPDGKIYFSMGDRGLNVGRIALPDEGAVLRCNPDGSDLELFARGLRNPQGLAFDAQGNLWTCDNNADMGDAARWLWVVEGGDYGWRVGYQYATDPWAAEVIPKGPRLRIRRESPWMEERLWEGKAPYVLPPVGYVTAGPCGIDFYPGTGLGERYEGHFFVCDFAFGVYSLAVRPKGSSFELVDVDRFLWGCWPTDAKFGPDGALYVADWLEGFPMKGKGRIYRVYDPAAKPSDARAILEGGMSRRPAGELARLLGHPNLVVRREAQFELVARKDAGTLKTVTASGASPARLHALWGLGQLGDDGAIAPLLKDPEPEVRAQAARLARGDFEALRRLLDDPSPRVRFYAAPSAGRAGRGRAVAPLLEFAAKSGDDPFLRHAAVLGLVEAGDHEGLLRAAGDPSVAVRRAVLLALRRMERPEIARFLKDGDPAIVLEAARAINDVPIPEALPALAELLLDPARPPTAALRALNAAWRTGRVKAVAEYAARAESPEAVRALGAWGHPSGRDRVVGAWRPLAPRDPGPAREAFERVAPRLFGGPEEVRVAAVRAAVDLQAAGAAERAGELFRDRAASSRVRAAAFGELLRIGRTEAVAEAAEDPDSEVRRLGIRHAGRLGAERAAPLLRKAALEGPLGVRQAAAGALGQLGGPEADRVLETLLDELVQGKLPRGLHLEVLEAAGRRAATRGRVSAYDGARAKEGPLAPYRETLEGGDPAEGRKIFYERATVACLRCHKVGGTGGEVGPPLDKVGGERTREELLESILFPNKVIAQGFGQEILKTTSDEVEVGRVRSETADEIVLVRADGTERRLAKRDVQLRKPGLSAMPEDLAKSLSKRDLRDLIAFLASLK